MADKVKSIAKEKDNFIKVYPFIYKYPSALSGSEIKLLLLLSFQMSWHTNQFLLDDDLIEILCSRLSVTRAYLLKVVKRLEKKGLLEKNGFYYRVNPDFARKGY